MSLSGPAALPGLRFLRSFRIPAVEIPNFSMIGIRVGVLGHSRGSVLESFVMSCRFIVHSLDSDRGPFVVKTDWNWELSRLTFCWVISLSLCLSWGAANLVLLRVLQKSKYCFTITGGTLLKP